MVLLAARWRDGCRHEILAQAQNVILPLLFECFHLNHAQNLLQTLITRWILFLMSIKLSVKLYEQTTLLQVVTKVTRLTVVCAFVFVIEAMRVECGERSERRHLARPDGGV